MFMPRKIHDSRGQQVGGTQTVQNQQAQALQSQLQGDLFHLQLVGDVDDGQFPDEVLSAREKAEDELMKDAEEGNAETRGRQGLDGSLGDALERPFYDFEKQTWSLRFSDLPEVAGRRPVASRMISSVDIIDGNAIEFMDALGYKLV
jgi:Med18 protein